MSLVAPSSQGELERTKAELWFRGRLATMKLWACQREVYDAYVASKDRVFVFEIGRRFGKSFIAAVLCTELALRKPGAKMQYAASTANAVEEIFLDNLAIVLDGCPAHLMPEIIISKGKVIWPNGSSIKMVGAEDRKKADRLRGPKSDLFIIDEAGFIPDLKYLMVTVAAPMLLTTGGRMLIASTPAKSVGHRFTGLCVEAEAKGNHVYRNIYHSTVNSSPALIAEFIELCGGEDTPEWQGEYLAKRVTDEHRAIIPEFIPAKADIVKTVTPPKYYDTYVAMDVGFSPSLTVVLFGYWDLERATLCIQREVVMSKMTTDELAGSVEVAERELWAEYFERVEAERPLEPNIGQVYHRVSDVDLRLIHDMANLHGLDFSPAQKDDKDAAINVVRMMVRRRKLQIDPCCPVLISHLEAGIWNARRTQYEFMDGFGHFDAIDALIYMRRHIDESNNPYPPESFGKGPDYFTRHEPNQAREALSELFG